MRCLIRVSLSLGCNNLCEHTLHTSYVCVACLRQFCLGVWLAIVLLQKVLGVLLFGSSRSHIMLYKYRKGGKYITSIANC